MKNYTLNPQAVAIAAAILVASITGVAIFGDVSVGTADNAGNVYVLGAGDSALDTACQSEFGENYSSIGWMASNPPAVQCSHPNGTQAIMDMPEDIARDKGITSADFQNEAVDE